MDIGNTKNQILQIISNNPGISAKGILDKIKVTRAMTFRHLAHLAQNEKIYKIGKTPKVQYYPKINMTNFTKNEQITFHWASTGTIELAPTDYLCATRDIFQARQEKLLTTLKNIISKNLLYLMVGMVGEIGNNSFDHNLGNWLDIPGVLFTSDNQTRTITLADRGRGVLSTIQHVRPETQTDQDALRIAFTEIISGRAPEQRGNGLKFVKKIIEENNLTLQFYSGRAMVEIMNGKFTINNSDKIIPGSLAIIKF